MNIIKPISIVFLFLLTGLTLFNHFHSIKVERDQQKSLPAWIHKNFVNHPLKMDKYDAPEMYARLYNRIKTGYHESEPNYGLNYKMNALERAIRRGTASIRSRSITFKERGPSNVPGRTRAVLADPQDPDNIWYAASVGGGIWKTNNAGGSWRHLTPNIPNLWVNALAMAPSNPNIMYAGTGEQGFTVQVANGDGMYKSIDRGETWEQLPNTVNNPIFQTITRIIVHPENENIVLASARSDVNFRGDTASFFSSGIFKSVDGGSNWTLVYEVNNSVQQLLPNPNNFNEIYATILNQGVIKSTDMGERWEPATKGLPRNEGRTEITISTQDPQILYACVSTFRESLTFNRFVNGDVYYTENGGKQWSLLLPENNGPDYSLLNGQGNYNNTILVHPFDDSTIYLGGVDMWKIRLSTQPDSIIDTVIFEPNGTERFIDIGRSVLRGDPFDTLGINSLNSVEIRFGPGVSQFAHRYTDPLGGVFPPTSSTEYRDFVRVPFQIWNIENNRQLHVSFLDVNNDSSYTVGTNIFNTDIIFINHDRYEALPNRVLSQTDGLLANTLYAFFPSLPPSKNWNPNNLPESKIRIAVEPYRIKKRTTQVMVDSRSQVQGDNRNRNRWNVVENTGVHPDQHAFDVILGPGATEFSILVGNDGGIYISEPDADPGVEEGSWKMVGNTYNTTQIYGADKRPGFEQYLGGAQDNGTWIFSGSLAEDAAAVADASTQYFNFIGGDGFEVVWHKTRPNTFIGGSQFNGFRRVVEDGSVETSVEGLDDRGSSAPFVSRLANTVSDPDLLFTIGRSGVWRSENFGGFWSLSEVPGRISLSGVPDVDVSRSDPQVVWAGSGMGTGGSIFVSTDGGFSFITTEEYMNIGPLTGIYTHPLEDSTVFVTFGVAERPKLLRSADLGQTWEDLSGFSAPSTSTGFPDVATISMVVLPHEPQTIWAGTEIGIFESRDNGQTWNIIEEFPKAMIWDMKIVEDEIVISTYGRGIWTATIPELLTVTYPEVTLAPRILTFSSTLDTSPHLQATLELRSAYDSTQIILNDAVVKILNSNNDSIRIQEIFDRIPNDSVDLYTLRLISYESGRAYQSGVRRFDKQDIIAFAPARSFYQTRFTEEEYFYLPTSFEIREEAGFSGIALHSDHPYIEGSRATGDVIDYIVTLTVPIVVAESDAFLTYKDVAIIETGEEGAKFGESRFYDYVVVEGSQDLVNWKPLAPGYDARFDSIWLTVYENDSVGDESMFVSHTLDLLETFQAGDTIAIRFRLFSDPFAAGWGWVIDDLSIQTTPVSTQSPFSANLGISVFPNPVSDYLHVTISGHKTQISWQIHNLNGQIVRQGQTLPVTPEKVIIPVASLPSGTYLMNVDTGKDIRVRKFVKK